MVSPGTWEEQILQHCFSTAVNRYPWSYKQLRIIAHLLMFPTFCTNYLYTKPLIQMYQRMPIQSQDTSLFNFQNHTPHLSHHDTHLHCRDILHFNVQLVLWRRYPECFVLGHNPALSRKCAAGRWGTVGCSLLIHTGISFITGSRISSMMPSHITKTRATNM